MRCLNCGAQGAISFCPDCGQRHVPLEEYGLRAVVTDYTLQEVSKLKLLRALISLFRAPGQLTAEFMAGRRKSQVNPLWMYAFVLSVTLALQRWLYPLIDVDGAGSVTRGPANVSVNVGTEEQQAFLESLIPLSQEISSYAAPLLSVVAWFVAARLLYTRSSLSAGVFALHLCTAELLFVQPFTLLDEADVHWSTDIAGTAVPLMFGLVYGSLAFRTLYEDQHRRPMLRALLGWLLATLVFTLAFTVFVTLTVLVLVLAAIGPEAISLG